MACICALLAELLVSHIDRLQAARLYAGNIEYGYFVRGMEARVSMSAAADANQLITYVAQLSQDEIR